MSRLQTIAPDPVKSLCAMSAEEWRAGAVAAANFALSQTGLHEAETQRAPFAVRAGQSIGDRDRAALQKLQDGFDEEYFSLQEHDRAQEVGEQAMAAFARARKVASLLDACEVDSFRAAAESIYEAAATTDKPSELFAHVEAVWVG